MRPYVRGLVRSPRKTDAILEKAVGSWEGGGYSHMEQTGMLVGNFEFNP